MCVLSNIVCEVTASSCNEKISVGKLSSLSVKLVKTVATGDRVN